MRIYFLGPNGTHGHEAATRIKWQLFPEAELCPCATNAEAVRAFFREKDTSIACVPIENSIQGAVTQTWDTLTAEIAQIDSYRCEHRPSAGIQTAVTVTIHHYPIYRDGTVFGLVKYVYSHPQALAQCQHHIQTLFPQAEAVPVNSTAEAVRKVSAQTSTDCVAIAGRQAAALYGLDCGADPIEDRTGNATRFAIIGERDSFQEVPQLDGLRTDELVSICLRGVSDQPGGLVGALQPFANAGLNLARVESRPVGDQLGNYVFYVDVSMKGDTAANRRTVDEVMLGMRSRHVETIVLGAYPVYESD